MTQRDSPPPPPLHAGERRNGHSQRTHLLVLGLARGQQLLPLPLLALLLPAVLLQRRHGRHVPLHVRLGAAARRAVLVVVARHALRLGHRGVAGNVPAAVQRVGVAAGAGLHAVVRQRAARALGLLRRHLRRTVQRGWLCFVGGRRTAQVTSSRTFRQRQARTSNAAPWLTLPHWHGSHSHTSHTSS